MRLALLILAGAALTSSDDKDELAQALSRAAQLESYAFKGETEFQSVLPNAPQQIPSMDGKYQKGVGLHIQAGERGEIFKKDDRILVKAAQGEWQDSAQFQPPAGANKPRAALFGRLILRTLKAPHEELRELAKAFKEVKKEESKEPIDGKDCTVFRGELADEALKASPLGRLLAQFGGAAAELKGTTKFWVDGQGDVKIYEISTRASLEIQGNAVDFTLIRRAEITDAGKVKVTVPEGARKLLEAKREPVPTDK